MGAFQFCSTLCIFLSIISACIFTTGGCPHPLRCTKKSLGFWSFFSLLSTSTSWSLQAQQHMVRCSTEDGNGTDFADSALWMLPTRLHTEDTLDYTLLLMYEGKWDTEHSGRLATKLACSLLKRKYGADVPIIAFLQDKKNTCSPPAEQTTKLLLRQ